jgi:murein DD-endopeptidase MepM/ murein hydrolase activator NlpD
MKNAKFVYNTKTLQYEVAKFSIRRLVLYILSVLGVGGLFAIGLVFAHNKFIETEIEVKLKQENVLLRKNLPIIKSEIASLENTVQALEEQEEHLYTTLFNTAPDKKLTEPTIAREKILLADASEFKEYYKKVYERSSQLLTYASENNELFGELITITKSDLRSLTLIPSIQPIQNDHLTALTSGYGKRINPFHKGSYFHPGIDFIASRGTDVYATAPGKVKHIDRSKLLAGYGNQIIIEHANGYSTRYAHLDEIFVKVGEQLNKGKVIGTVGNSGGSSAPHLHYEVLKDGEQINPIHFLLEGLTSAQHQTLLELSQKSNQSLD